jgi:hypothetical protein
MIATSVVAIVVEIAVLCYRSVARTVPWNYIALLLYTVCMSYMVSFICSAVGHNSNGSVNKNGQLIVLAAAVMTMGVTIALTV